MFLVLKGKWDLFPCNKNFCPKKSVTQQFTIESDFPQQVFFSIPHHPSPSGSSDSVIIFRIAAKVVPSSLEWSACPPKMPCHPEGFESKPRSRWKKPMGDKKTQHHPKIPSQKNNRKICHRLSKKTTKLLTSNSTLMESYLNCWVSWSNDSKKFWSWNPGIENFLPWDSWFTVSLKHLTWQPGPLLRSMTLGISRFSQTSWDVTHDENPGIPK